MIVTFYNKDHENAFDDVINRMKSQDCYHQALAYLITLDTVCRHHIDDLYDFKQDIILYEGLKQPWQTGTSLRTTRLAFNLWVGFVDNDPRRSTPEDLFCCSYAPYYCEAIKLRYPEYMSK